MRRRQTTFFEREQNILATAEQLLLESGNGDIKLDELASQLDIAKGTLYKHIASKDELYLKILIRYEKSLADINAIKDDPSAQITRMVLQLLLRPQRAMLFNQLEEHLASTKTGLSKQFAELYRIRRERMNDLLATTQLYLDSKNSHLSTRDYLSTIWAIGQGGASLLNSSFYQRYLGRRDTLIVSLVSQVLQLPALYPAPTPKPTPVKLEPDSFSPFGKLSPPSL